uniref:CLOCK-interacting pacemaker n=1 Tax=Callorhinchus milii TaxID=7868 RepID=A0A4W3H0H9_CALMI|eukprot:gi/632989199/ref/XP_007883520.1/ PREDICTED: CLOCK-interacting pacemaker [Callorhinchus milii]
MSADKVSEMISESFKHDQDGIQASVKSENSSDGQRGQVQRRSSVVNSRKRHRPSTSESEKDSGFSDTSSEYLSAVEQMDCEDQASLNLVCGRHSALRRAHKAAVLRNPFTGLAPVYIMIKEPLSIPTGDQLLHAQLRAWGRARPPLGTAPDPNRVLVLRQPLPAKSRPLRTEENAGAGKDTYLPILNSYPKIAPHPDRRSPGLLLEAGHRVSKRSSGPEAGRSPSEASPFPSTRPPAKAPVTSQQPPAFGLGHRVNDPEVTSWSSPSSSLSLPSPLSQPALSSSSLPLCSLFPRGTSRSASVRAFAGSGPGNAAGKKQRSNLLKHRRFHNTLEILDKSGLLGITLRTKELIRQNSSTQREISELKEHTRLLCRAVQSNDPRAWDRLHETMRCSGSYGDLTSRSDSPCSLFSQTAALGPVLSATDISPS